MLPVIALIGQPNVGKSTLFNCLTRSREALVADYPGLTRDRKYGRVEKINRDCLVVDAGGVTDTQNGVVKFISKQTQIAMNEADIVLFLIDARAGINSLDQDIASSLRKLSKPIILVLNKIDGLNAELVVIDFYSLALGIPMPISATHTKGIQNLLVRIETMLPIAEQMEAQEESISISIIGRPNVGKSTLINCLLGEERVVVFSEAGTTRDSIYIPFKRDNQKFTLIDTAGIRRKSKVSLVVEKFSIIKSLQAVEKSSVVIYLIDASEGVTDQDAYLLGLILEIGRALVIGLNKWDNISAVQKTLVNKQLDIKLSFLKFVEKYPVSALHGSGVGKLFAVVRKLHKTTMIDMSTSILTRILQESVESHQPPLVKGRRIKLKYAHQGKRNPPTIVIHGVQTDLLPETYKGYLINAFRNQLKLSGTPIKLIFKTSNNPFKDRKNNNPFRGKKTPNNYPRHTKKYSK